MRAPEVAIVLVGEKRSAIDMATQILAGIAPEAKVSLAVFDDGEEEPASWLLLARLYGASWHAVLVILKEEPR